MRPAPTLWGAALAVVLVAGGVSAPAPARAIELFGIRLFEPPPEPQPGEVAYTVTFNAETEDSGLANRLRNASQLYDQRSQFSPGSAALIATARGDYQRILGALYSEGRYGGTISIHIDGLEAADLPLDTELGSSTTVDIAVRPGAAYLFDDIAIENRPGPVPGDLTVPPTPEEHGLVPGNVAKSGVIVASEGALLSSWRELGHPLPEVAHRRVSAYHERDAIDVDIAINPGRAAVFGKTTVTGTDRMDPDFVAYYADIPEGAQFDPDTIERAEKQLRRLEVFSASRIIEGDRVRDDGSLPLEIAVVERKRRVFGGGASISTLDGAAVEGYWRHRNLFGRAEKLSLDARVGGIDAQDPDEYNYYVGATFKKPGVFTPYTDLDATIYAEQESPDTFRSRGFGGQIGFTHRVNRHLTVGLAGAYEYSSIDQTTVGDGEFNFFSLPAFARWDNTDNELDPSKGFRVFANVEPFYESNYQNAGVISEVDARVYQGFADKRLILAGRAAFGSIAGAPLQETPANRLYFAGGGGSIRGYPYKGVGPVDANGDVYGGRSMFVASAEARVRVTPSIGIVPFVDVGNAFTSELPDFDEPLKVGVGVGARYYTGFGPIRLDVAVPLDPFDGDPNVAFYIGLGQAF